MLPASQPSLSPEIPEKRRCWECQRRRLVCDSVKPVCNKCRASGIVCPGYDDRKPLTWLAPGKITCRTRRKGRGVDKDTGAKKDTKAKTKPKPKRPGEPEDSEAFIRSKNKYGGELVFHSALRTDICDVFEAVQYCKLHTTRLDKRSCHYSKPAKFSNTGIIQSTTCSIHTRSRGTHQLATCSSLKFPSRSSNICRSRLRTIWWALCTIIVCMCKKNGRMIAHLYHMPNTVCTIIGVCRYGLSTKISPIRRPRVAMLY